MRIAYSVGGALALALLGSLAACDRPGGKAPDVLARRAKLEAQAEQGARAVPALAAALDDPSPLVRRTAARLLLEMGEPGHDALLKAVDNADLLVRRTALKAASGLPPDKALPCLAKALKDKDVMVRQAAVTQLVAIEPRTPKVKELIGLASKDDAEPIRLVALKHLWPFHRKSKSIRDDPTYDHDVKVAQAIALPKDGWRFALDPRRDGHNKGWFKPSFNDSKWRTIAIEQAWQKAGVMHTGVAWYRRTITLPAKPKHVAVEIRFLGVDECAWVWVNGVYVGDHDLGPSGWNQEFTLDITKELKWGAKNQITVRAMNTAHAGGIWRPVVIEVLQ